MADDFKEFDKSTLGGTLRYKWLRFDRTQIIMVALLMTSILGMLLFVGLYAHAEYLRQHDKNAPVYCTNSSCVQTAARLMSYMNLSADPCEDFFQYACGNYGKVNPYYLTPGIEVDVTQAISKENEQRLIKLLENPFPVKPGQGAEMKLRAFYHSCMHQWARAAYKGLPLLDALEKDLGGLYLLGNWNDSNWNFNDALKKVHSDFRVHVFYEVSVKFDSGRQIVIKNGGISPISRFHQFSVANFNESFRNLIMKVGTYLIQDRSNSNAKLSKEEQTRLEVFVNDTMEVEATLASYFHETYPDHYYDEDHGLGATVSLKQLNDFVLGHIDWVDQMKNLIRSMPITKETRVEIEDKFYFTKSVAHALSLGNRKLNNYMAWRVTEQFLMVLSWRYRNALHAFWEDSMPYPVPPPTQQQTCFMHAQVFMQDALNFLFLKYHFESYDKKQLTELANNVKKATLSALNRTTWMDDTARKNINKFFETVSFRFGSPDWVSEQSVVDQIYSSVAISPTNFFDNVLGLRQESWKRFSNPHHHDRWEEGDEALYYQPREPKLIYDPSADTMHHYVNTFAGLLQAPVYTKEQPSSLTYGSMGFRTASYLLKPVEEYIYKSTTFGASELSSKTVDGYKKAINCVADKYRNITKEHRIPGHPNIKITDIDKSHNAYKYYVSTQSILVALEAYKDELKSGRAQAVSLPGLKLSSLQLVFLGYTQSYCYSRHPLFSVILSRHPDLIDMDSQINLGLGELPEFSQAFNCKAGAKMNHANKCPYF